MCPRGHVSRLSVLRRVWRIPTRLSPVLMPPPRRIRPRAARDSRPRAATWPRPRQPGPRPPQPHTSDGAGTGSRAKPGNSGYRRLAVPETEQERPPQSIKIHALVLPETGHWQSSVARACTALLGRAGCPAQRSPPDCQSCCELRSPRGARCGAGGSTAAAVGHDGHGERARPGTRLRLGRRS